MMTHPSTLSELLTGHPFADGEPVVESGDGPLSLGELRARVAVLADALRAAGVQPGQAVGNLVTPGPSSVVVMFAVWAAGAVYVPVNVRSAAAEVAELTGETRAVLLVGPPAGLAARAPGIGAVSYQHESGAAAVLRPARASGGYPPDVAVISRTSGTTGRPKAVLLRHSGTIAALDASLRKLRGRDRAQTPAGGGTRRMNLIPVSLALWAGVWNMLFSFRAGFGVVLLDPFSTAGFARAVQAHDIRSTVLAPAMITMLADDPAITDLSPLRMVRSITAPLSPDGARRFHEKFGAFVLNSYGQTELGGEVVGWTAADMREFGERKLGAAGRPYRDVDLRIRRDDGSEAGAGERGEIFVRSPFRMGGYAGTGAAGQESADERFVDGYLRTGDLGWVDADGFLWIEGRVSDMINRGGLKVFPDEVEEVLRRHPAVGDAGVAPVPDPRLGEVPHAWIVSCQEIDAAELSAWCREYLAPYKVPAGFTRIDALPRSAVGKLLRRELTAGRGGRLRWRICEEDRQVPRYQTLDYTECDGVAWVTLNRPEVHNAFDTRMMREISDCWHQLRGNEDVRVVVLTGAGEKAFCAGLDRAELDRTPTMLGTTGEADAFGQVGSTPLHVNDAVDLLPPKTAGQLWKPVIAAVNGMACGGAFYLLGEVEFIIAAEHATFFDPHTTYGLATVYEPMLMLQRMPLGEVMRMSLLGAAERLSARRAHEIGLVQEVVPAADLHEAARRVAEVIAAQPPLAVQSTVRAIWYAQELGHRQALDVARTLSMLGTDGKSLAAGQEVVRSGLRGKWRLL